MIDRRTFLKQSLAGAGAYSLASQNLFSANVNSKKPPIRFIFMTKASGLRPLELTPVSFSSKEKDMDKTKMPMSADLTKHELPKWMSALDGHKKDMAVVQGLSAYKIALGHHAHQSCLGMYATGESPRADKLLWATVDVELGRCYPSPFEHIELQTVSGKSGIVDGRAALGKAQRNYAYADPRTALSELFKFAAKSEKTQNKLQADSMVLDYLKKSSEISLTGLKDIEELKLRNYTSSINSIKSRNQLLKSMASEIAPHVPKVNEDSFADDAPTMMVHEANIEILLAALKAGLTNSALVSLETLLTFYRGIPQLDEDEIVSLHALGHGNSVGEFSSDTVRELIRTHHMKLINRMVTELKNTPEGEGTMFDNTVITYQAENGETHHSSGIEQPILMLAGKNTKMNFLGNYIRLPFHGEKGHSTLGNWYTTILNNHGNDIPHFGVDDLLLKSRGLSYRGPVKEFLV